MSRANILQVTATSTLGGTERMVLNFLERADRDKYNLYLSSLYDRGPLLEEAARLGVETLNLDADRRGLLSSFLRLRRFMAGRRIHLVHLYGLRTNTLGRLAARLAGVPVVVGGIRGIDNWRRWYHVWLDRSTAPLVSMYISNSQAGRRMATRRERIPPDKIVVSYTGIDPAAYEPGAYRAALRTDYGLGPGERVIGVIAHLRPRKGHEVVVEAIPRIATRFPDVRFLFAGKDQLSGQVQRLVREKGRDRWVVFAGFCPDVRPLLSLCELFLLPSLDEGLPASILEAMAMRLPVVASDVGGVSELVVDGETGLLIPPGDPQALAGAVISLLSDPARAGEMGRAGRRRVEQHFTLERMVASIEEIYDRLLVGEL